MADPTYDLETDIGRLRLLISDVGGEDGTSFIFQDDEVEAFIEIGGSVLAGAAQAARALAGNAVLVSKRIKFLELETDGPSESKALIQLAEGWESQDDDDGEVTIIDMADDPFADRTRRGL